MVDNDNDDRLKHLPQNMVKEKDKYIYLFISEAS